MKTLSISKYVLIFSLFIQATAFAAETPKTDDKPKGTKTIMLISGAFVTSDGWGEWKSYLESKGYIVIVPAWPYKDGTVDGLRAKHKDSIPSEYDLKKIVDYHAAIIDKLPEKPILIGHSFGGLIVQLLLQRDKGAAGIAYHSVPAKGVFVYKYSFLKALSGPLGLFRSEDTTFLMSFKQWQYAFTNGMPEAEQRAYYDKLVVPESRKVIRGALKDMGKIDFKKEHAPLLFVSGSTDNIIPASLNKKNYERYIKYQPEGSVTEYKEFEGRNHLAMSQPTWQEDVNYIIAWASKY
ncbi:alpha/beta fold hydrolase [Flavobacterium sp. Sd200]|uniref:alpha/beta hydrolase n=1 Tax=Flavobacterium sp. Sd200 TaxID=2692211 RepID=UPI00136ADB7C|nr:alpha/beta hydrolase [Flavobacterium sp. Sd200]MXN90356.1 alpha/beta fold hydrolase [Flavobacterium sp. Sd200]